MFKKFESAFEKPLQNGFICFWNDFKEWILEALISKLCDIFYLT